METIKSKKEKIEELLEEQKRNLLEENSLTEHRDEIRKASSLCLKDKLQTEMQVRMHQCDILKSKLTLLRAKNEGEAEDARKTIASNENTSQTLEAQLRSCEQDICELERQEKTCAGQLKKLTEAKASLEQLIQIAQSELGEEESRYTALVKKRTFLQKQLHKAISEERSRIKIASTIQVARAARNHKRYLLLLQKKERKRLKRLDQFMEDL